jgi:tungstate transport system substrate-binding protein
VRPASGVHAHGPGAAAALILISLVVLSSCQAAKKDVILATTTSTQDTGLLDVLVPMFEKKTGYRVKTVAVGTGQALAMGQKGEADVMLVHAPSSELPLVDSGVAVNRRPVMHNDFVIAGPASDPAKIKGLSSATQAFTEISRSGSRFISRGDDSGTHKKELEVWKAAGVTPKPAGSKAPAWYQETGAGMGQTLAVASEKDGYVLTDRATFLSLGKNIALQLLVGGDKTLLNIYHVMQVNPEKFPKVNAKGAKAFVEFLVSPEIQKVIGDFGKDKYGQSLFFPDAGKPEF